VIGGPEQRDVGGETGGDTLPEKAGATDGVAQLLGPQTMDVAGEVDRPEVGEDESVRLRCELDGCLDQVLLVPGLLEAGSPIHDPGERAAGE
jgi:hypothetical protein